MEGSKTVEKDRPLSEPASNENPISVTKNGVIHSFSDSELKSLFDKKTLLIFLIILILGIVSGNVLYNLNVPIQKSLNIGNLSSGLGSISTSKGQVFGSSDEKTFKDTTEGVMKEGGVDGEGAYHLERPGGESQNVYLTSSIIDLSKFMGKKVKVWGETNAAKKAGWLMDVGRLQVL